GPVQHGGWVATGQQGAGPRDHLDEGERDQGMCQNRPSRYTAATQLSSTRYKHLGLLDCFWSEWQDLNLRPPRPERGALPDCATLRLKAGLITPAPPNASLRRP